MPQYQSVLGFQIGTKPFAASINCQPHIMGLCRMVCSDPVGFV